MAPIVVSSRSSISWPSNITIDINVPPAPVLFAPFLLRFFTSTYSILVLKMGGLALSSRLRFRK